jgi:NitT/TauT family transport system substrate-binding protein
MGKILKTKRLTTLAEGLVLTLGLAIILSVVFFFKKSTLDTRANIEVASNEKLIRIAVNTWGGFAGGQYWNGGFDVNREKSRFFKDNNLLVEFVLIDDFTASREALKSDKVDLIWSTVDLFPTDAPNLPDNVKIVFQSDWSRGGDAVVSRPGIDNVSDLKNKKVAVSLLTPSHTLLISLLEQSGLNLSDIKIVETANAMDAASMFKSGQVDAAIVWSPDDQDCLAAVKGSKILTSTKTATHIIADVLVAKDKFIEENHDALVALYEGWMKGAAEINSSDVAKRKASKILANNFEGVDEAFCLTAINNARLNTHGDNLNFFGLNDSYKGVTGENIWNKMTVAYTKLGYVQKQMNWRSVHTDKIIKSAKLNGGSGQESEKIKVFIAPTKEMSDNKLVTAFSKKSASITFDNGDYILSDEAKFIIDKEFVDIAKINTTARIRIIGNTDNTGSYLKNMSLSKSRAQAVADYLINEYDIKSNRIIIVGNGPKDAISDGVNGSSEKYRRTDFELIVE